MTPSRSINRRAGRKYTYPVMHHRVVSQRISINTELQAMKRALQYQD